MKLLLSLLLAAPFASFESVPVDLDRVAPLSISRMAEPQDGLATSKNRRALRGLLADVAGLGEEQLVSDLRELLLRLGDEPKDHEQLEDRWQRKLDGAKPEKSDRARVSLGKKLAKVAGKFGAELADLDGERREALAQVILDLDSMSERASTVLGHKLHKGVWLSEQAIQWQARAADMTELLQRALALDIDIARAASSNPTALAIYGEAAHQVSAFGVTLHGGIPAAKLERILRQSLRAMAFSNAILTGQLQVPKWSAKYSLVMLSEAAHYDQAIEEAHKTGGLSGASYELQTSQTIIAYQDSRGWEVDRWQPEAGFQTMVITHIGNDRQSPVWLAPGTQPCFVAGHLSWLCLSFFGQALPTYRVRDDDNGGGTVSAQAARVDSLWDAASKSLFGCRAWMKARLDQGARFPFAKAILDQLGKIKAEPLLKATLLNEYLQISGELPALLAATRSSNLNQSAADRIRMIEGALGRTLPELDDEWVTWLQSGGAGNGVLQRLLSGGPGAQSRKGEPAILARLNDVREAAFGGLNIPFATVELFDELSDQSRKHAQYLALNPDQASVWPDAHEEYADRPGFSPEGSWAGLHSVITFTADPVEAIDGWMGTFYHRLPLLEPGLFGAGYGLEQNITVLDTSSLVAPFRNEAWIVWPAKNSTRVGRRFQPELPNPVPGEDQDEWGYPITIQAFWGDAKEERTLTMELFEGGSAVGAAVPCHFISPSAPAFPKLAPKDAFCLIPKEHLKASTTYTVRAECPGTQDRQTWSFTTGK